MKLTQVILFGLTEARMQDISKMVPSAESGTTIDWDNPDIDWRGIGHIIEVTTPDSFDSQDVFRLGVLIGSLILLVQGNTFNHHKHSQLMKKKAMDLRSSIALLAAMPITAFTDELFLIKQRMIADAEGYDGMIRHDDSLSDVVAALGTTEDTSGLLSRSVVGSRFQDAAFGD